MKLALFIIGSYLLGAIPFGILIASMHGIDLRKIGSGNIGATNLARALGKKWAYVCFVLDLAKGLLPTFLAGVWFVKGGSWGLIAQLAVGCAAIIGHIFPVYLKFKGGKGVATSFGVALGLWPYYTISAVIALVIWIIAVLIWKYVSLASLLGALSFPVFLIISILIIPAWHLNNLWPLVIIALIIPIMVFIRHKDNVVRLMAGTENKILQK